MRTIKTFLIAFLLGIAAGAASIYFLLNQKPDTKAEVAVRQISGEKIEHSGFNFSGKNITFKTASDGKGEIETEIPKQLVPEAANWINRVQSVTLSYGYKFDHDGTAPYFGLQYGYRLSRIMLGGGVDFSRDFIGIKASAGLCW